MSVHTSKEWKQKADEFKKGKICEWCGVDKYLHVHHPNGWETHQKRILGQAYGQFRMEYSKKYPRDKYPRKRVIDEKTGKVTYPKNNEAPDFKQEFVKWKVEQRIDDIIEEAHKKYLSLEGCIVLCRKCHFAAEHGMDLCPKCKTGYKNIRHETCFNCLPDDIKNKITLHKKNVREKYESEDIWDCESFEETEEYKQQCIVE